MHAVGSILVASDLSIGAKRALTRAVMVAVKQDAALTVLHVADVVPEAPGVGERTALHEAEARLLADVEPLVRRYRSERPLKVEIRVVPGRAFLEIIAEARARAAALVVLGAHGAHAMRDLFLGTTAEKVLRKGDRPVLLVKRQPRGPYRRVLVAVDFSEVSSRALASARALAPEAALSTLHVCDVAAEGMLRRSGAAADEVTRYRKQCLQSGAVQLEAFLRESGSVSGDGHGAAVARVVAAGRPEVVVPEVARRRRADLVVIGTHGRTGLRHLLLGSVAEHVLRDATCDVLAVRPEGFRFEMP